MLTRTAYVHQHAVISTVFNLLFFTWRQAEWNGAVLVKEERKLINSHHLNISLSKNCLFLTPLHSNGKGDRLSALLGRHHKVLHQTD